MPNFLQSDYGIRESMADTAVPASGQWAKMDKVEKSAPAVGTPISWICTAAGSPGTWVANNVLQNVASITTATGAAAVAVTDNIVLVTGSGGHNLTLAVPAAANNGTVVNITNTSFYPLDKQFITDKFFSIVPMNIKIMG